MGVLKDTCAKRIRNVGQHSLGLLSGIHCDSGGELLALNLSHERGPRIFPNLAANNESLINGHGGIQVPITLLSSPLWATARWLEYHRPRVMSSEGSGAALPNSPGANVITISALRIGSCDSVCHTQRIHSQYVPPTNSSTRVSDV
jgi:hypothetical protein